MLLYFKTLLKHQCLHNLSLLLSWMYVLLNKAHANAKLFCFQSDYVALPLIHVCTVTRCNGISCCFNVMNPVLPALKSCCWKWLHKTERLWLKPLQSFRTPAYCKKLFLFHFVGGGGLRWLKIVLKTSLNILPFYSF